MGDSASKTLKEYEQILTETFLVYIICLWMLDMLKNLQGNQMMSYHQKQASYRLFVYS
jgi:glycopeptide antibiotics resistance protein